MSNLPASIRHALTMNLGDRSYGIYVGRECLKDIAWVRQHIKGHQVMVVTNTCVAEHVWPILKSCFADLQCDLVTLPDGENYKNIESLQTIFDALIDQRHERQTTLIALGGGVICDLTGLAAACYHRGVSYVQIPTTLLAQVDAAVGGKTAINYRQIKNNIGVIYQPQAVIIDVDTLKTLPSREFNAGLAEIIKIALIADPEFFMWLERHMTEIQARNPEAMMEAIATAVNLKSHIVSQDEYEQGIREYLNLGHTFGHAIEHVLGHGTWLHGEAVGLGLLMAARLSAQLSGLGHAQVARIQHLLEQAQLPRALPPDVKPEAVLEAMQFDKKIRDQKLRFVVLTSMGQARVVTGVPSEWLLDVLQKDSE